MAYFRERRELLRGKNDGPHDAQMTATLRGQIATYTELLNLDKDPPFSN